jgi:hypothetical protein
MSNVVALVLPAVRLTCASPLPVLIETFLYQAITIGKDAFAPNLPKPCPKRSLVDQSGIAIEMFGTEHWRPSWAGPPFALGADFASPSMFDCEDARPPHTPSATKATARTGDPVPEAIGSGNAMK